MSLRVGTLGIAAAAVITACSGPVAEGPSSTPTSVIEQPSINVAPIGYNAADFSFTKNMIAQHQQALQISAGVAQQASNSGVVELAQKASTTLQADLSTLKVFLVQWTENPDSKSGGDGSSAAPSGMLDAATISRLGELQGEEFDALWLRSMAHSSQGAVEIATREISSGQNPDGLTLAKQIVGSQQAVLKEINALLAG